MISTIALNFYSSASVFAALSAELGWSLEDLSFTYFLNSVVVVLFMPLLGRMLDARGAIGIITISVLAEAVKFTLLGTLPAQFHLYVAMQLSLTLFGLGTNSPSTARVIIQHFTQHRGLALGITVGTLGLMAMGLPLMLHQIIATHGWRSGYLTLTGIVLLLGLPGLYLIRSGSTRAVRTATAYPCVAQAELGFLRWPLFWVLLILFLITIVCTSGYVVLMLSLLKTRGIDGAHAAAMQALVGAAVLVGRLSSGALMDRFASTRVASSIFGLSAIGCLLLTMDNPALAPVGAFLIGLTVGAELDIVAYVMAYYFGRQNFGRTYGLSYGAMILCSGISPTLITGLSRSGDYTPALHACMTALGLAAVTFLLMPHMPHQSVQN